MKKIKFILSAILFLTISVQGQQLATVQKGYKIGDVATDFQLKNVDNEMVSLSQYTDNKGFIVIFTCNHCPYAKAYENRIIALNEKYASLGYPVIAINPNDPKLEPTDSFEAM